MLSAFQNAFKIPDLRKRIIFTLLLLAVLRLGTHITVPGIDDAELDKFFQKLAPEEGGILRLYDLFAGRAFSQQHQERPQVRCSGGRGCEWLH